VSFLVSGNGSNFQAVAEKILSGYIYAESGIVISSSSEAFALERAKKLGIKSIAIEPKNFAAKDDHEAEMIKCLNLCKTDLIVAAGYMRILSTNFIQKFRNRIINIHPSLLPAFPGKNAQQQALDYGVKVTGCTTHFIDEGVDTGAIIMQSPVTIDVNDNINTLSTKIIKEEHKILIKSVKLFCEEKLIIEKRMVFEKK
jgi:phosphoribosylglycinamide formyltransferase-1